jgi:hypothetical protein
MYVDNINASAAAGERRPFPLDRERPDWLNEDRLRHPAFQRIFDRAEKPKGPDFR